MITIINRQAEGKGVLSIGFTFDELGALRDGRLLEIDNSHLALNQIPFAEKANLLLFAAANDEELSKACRQAGLITGDAVRSDCEGRAFP